MLAAATRNFMGAAQGTQECGKFIMRKIQLDQVNIVETCGGCGNAKTTNKLDSTKRVPVKACAPLT